MFESKRVLLVLIAGILSITPALAADDDEGSDAEVADLRAAHQKFFQAQNDYYRAVRKDPNGQHESILEKGNDEVSGVLRKKRKDFYGAMLGKVYDSLGRVTGDAKPGEEEAEETAAGVGGLAGSANSLKSTGGSAVGTYRSVVRRADGSEYGEPESQGIKLDPEKIPRILVFGQGEPAPETESERSPASDKKLPSEKLKTAK